MAAVFALLLFVIASVGVFVKLVAGGMTFSAVFAAILFVAIAAALFLALFTLTRHIEAESGPEH